MKYLSAEQLTKLDAYWKEWAYEDFSPKQKRNRLRLYFIYLLIRCGGLKLTEALAVNDNKDLSFSTSTIRIPGSRDVQVREVAMTEILRVLDAAELSGLHGSLSHIDPGSVRKNFYANADACNIDRSMGGPRVLRHSRGAELLEQGVSVESVQRYLGLQTPVQAIQMKSFREDEAKQIMQAHLRREALRHSSARNSFAGTVIQLIESKTMAEVVLASVSGMEIHAVISMEGAQSLDLRKDQILIASVKAPWVVLSPLGTITSYSNNFPATVLFIRKGVVEASVRLRLDDGTGMSALTTITAIERLGIAEGSRCTASFSSMSVMLSLGQ